MKVILVLLMREYFEVRSRESGVMESEIVKVELLLYKCKCMGHYKDLLAFQKAYSLAMRIFQITKTFPSEEKYSLTDQIRRSSRSVCTNIAEAYKRRRYKDYFISKLNDSETENTESEVWLDFAKDCCYLNEKEYYEFISLNTEVGKLIFYMIHNPDKFI